MEHQQDLFPEIETARQRALPQGFRYKEEVMSEEEESSLVKLLERLDLKPFEFHGYLANRRVASFGFRYDYTHEAIEVAEEFPDFLNHLRARVAHFAGSSIGEFQQVSVNEYSSGAGIGWHRDKSLFGVVAGLSLLTPATMRFRRVVGDAWIRTSQILQPRSLYLLEGEARTIWEHSIPPLSALRYSVTFRTLKKNLMPSKQ